MLGDLLAKGFTNLRVGNSKFKGANTHATSASSNIDATDFNPIHHLIKTATRDTAQDRIGVKLKTVHHQFSGVHTLVSHFLDFSGNC